jgi:phage tail-like protein
MAGELLTSTRFYFEADGLDALQMYSFEGLNAEVDIKGDQTVGSGKGAIGLRQATPAGREKYGKVTVKLYATNQKELWTWVRETITNAGTSDWASNRKASSITVYDQAGTMQARWECKNTTPTKYQVGSLKADGQDLLLEELTFMHEGVERVQ